jgi:hypothetical protein
MVAWGTDSLGVSMRHALGRDGLNARHFSSREQAAAQEALLVLAIQQDHPHDDILALPEQGADFGATGPFDGRYGLPNLPQSFEFI